VPGEALRLLLGPVADQVVVEADRSGNRSGGERGRGDGRAARAARRADGRPGGQRRAASVTVRPWKLLRCSSPACGSRLIQASAARAANAPMPKDRTIDVAIVSNS
jgi:hypothetical protein